MRSRILLLVAVMAGGIWGLALPASASYYHVDSYNLKRAEIRGYVESVDDQVAYIQTDYGEIVAVLLGPESYWDARRYYLPEGDYVEMEVWYDPTDQYADWYFAGEIWGPDYHLVLTNNEGVPYWIIFADDYYYSLGYRASCVSFMIWYDCPPVYFIYLALPPPPPRTYFCFYGPRWHAHHFAWHYGPRFCSGGSYWHDGRGHERPGHRNGSRSRFHPRGNGGGTGSSNSFSHDGSYRPPSGPVVTPDEKWQPRKKSMQRRTVKSQSEDRRRIAGSRNEYRRQTAASVPPTERKVNANKSESQKRQIETRSNDRTRQEIRESKIAYEKPLKKSDPYRTSRDEKRNSSPNSGKEIKKRNR